LIHFKVGTDFVVGKSENFDTKRSGFVVFIFNKFFLIFGDKTPEEKDNISVDVFKLKMHHK